VDLDYQGTLSNMCVAPKELLDYRSKTNNRTSQRLAAVSDLGNNSLPSLQ